MGKVAFRCREEGEWLCLWTELELAPAESRVPFALLLRRNLLLPYFRYAIMDGGVVGLMAELPAMASRGEARAGEMLEVGKSEVEWFLGHRQGEKIPGRKWAAGKNNLGKAKEYIGAACEELGLRYLQTTARSGQIVTTLGKSPP